MTIHRLNGDAAGDALGQSVSGAGDVNGDGIPDFIAGAYRNDDNGTDAGMARVYSGADGSVLYTFRGDSAGDWFGWSVSGAGDVNGDNFADVVVGAPGLRIFDLVGYARVFSGADGSIMYTFYADSAGDWFGGSVSGAGDVNADGFADLIVGAMFDDNNGNDSGSAKVFSGFDGTVIWSFNGDSRGDSFGNSVSGAGDVNADGFADLIVGATSDDNFGVAAGSARVFSGINGSVLYRFLGDTHNDNFGHSVSGAGDVNGDGFDDLIVGVPSDDKNGISSGSARVFTGRHGFMISIFYGDAEGDHFGLSVSGAGDVNGDGFADLIVGAPLSDNNGASSGSVRVFSGFDRSILFNMDGETTAKFLGTSVSGVGDINGDGLGDFIVGVIGDDNNGLASGSARIVLSLPNPTTPLDSDGDGILDSNDLDDDNDGIEDLLDPNPLDPFVCGDSDLDGCDDCSVGVDGFGVLSDFAPHNDGPDTDGDGVCDLGDLDDDNDGVPDGQDACPGTSPGEAVDLNGCSGSQTPRDSDGDGVPDGQDLCPGTALGEVVDLNGCSDSQVDSDGDGFCDPGAPSNGSSACTGSDNCPDSDQSATIIIDGIDTGVENVLQDDGCTLADLIDTILSTDPTSVDVVEFLIDLKAEGFITGQDLGAILKELNSP